MTIDEMTKVEARVKRARELRTLIHDLETQLSNLLDRTKSTTLCITNYAGSRCVRYVGTLHEEAATHFWLLEDKVLLTKELIAEAQQAVVDVVRRPFDARIAELKKEFAEL
jgi:hypothetical protein